MWVKKFSRVSNIQYEELVRGMGIVNDSYFPKTVKSCIILSTEHGFSDNYYKEKEWQNYVDKIAQYITRGKNFFNKHRLLYNSLSQKYLATTYPFQKNLSLLSNKKLLHLYQNFTRGVQKYFLFLYAPWAINEVIQPKFFKEVKEEYPKDADFIINAISNPTQQIRFNKQLKELFILKINNKLKGKELLKHTNKWGYLGLYSPQQEAFTANDFIKLSVGLNKQTIKQIENELKHNKKSLRQALKILAGDSQLLETAKLVNYYVYLRTERLDVYRQVTFKIKPLYKELDRRMGLNNYESSFATIDEILNFLKHNKLPNIEEIKQRTKIKYCFYCVNNKTKIILDKEKINAIWLKLNPANKGDSFKGFPAFKKNKIKGIVKIIFSLDQKNEFKQGQILVSSMTRSEFLPIIKKSKAIITDEGGITCHAAIISRELKIPCVIGTKIATQVLHDGDLVEVDANQGIVKILKRAK
jgi:phosphohistidine swiveling domain-containing protein